MSWIIQKLLSYPTNAIENDFGINLDLSYITKKILVCSFPTQRFPTTLYRNSLNDLVNYMDLMHRDHWNMWNLRIEGLEEYDLKSASVMGRVHHHPWPDHESPRFKQLVEIIDSIGKFLQQDDENVALIHCKLGKGRSGLVSISYLINKCGLRRKNAEQLFTNRRMKSGFGPGTSIFSQRRYIEYIELYNNIPYQEVRTYIKCLKVIGAVFDSFDSVQFNIQQYKENELSIPIVLKDVQSVGKDLILGVDLEMNPDLKISFEMKNKLGLSISLGYLWFNTYWESKINENNLILLFDWDQFDGYKGLNKKGYRIFQQMEVLMNVDI